MNEHKYHHGDLKKTLIKNGIKLLNEVGSENFSMRKLAALCNVSHTAPYKHFKNKDELIAAILEYVLKELELSLKEISTKNESPEKLSIELGKQYVKFMVANPDYLKILFLSDFQTEIILNNGKIESDYGAFNILKDTAVKAFKFSNIKEDDYARNIIAMWAMVHGLAIMIANKTIIYSGDIEKFVEDILENNMKF